MNTVRIEIPSNPTDCLKLASAIMQKHTNLNDGSPVKGLDWTANGPAITAASGFDNQAAQLHRDAEVATGERDKLMPAVVEFVRQNRDVLVGVYRQNPKKLGEFGFTVNDAVAKKNGHGNGQPPA